MKEFYVRSVQICRECDGSGLVFDRELQDECECPECDGQGRVYSDVSLVDALNEIATDRAA